ncbi:MAG: hypothetical protein GX755_09805 [Syntrophomonadaceae bacterium]|nr:hypothetical protein [Syntrophomonadaceae bacterium]
MVMSRDEALRVIHKRFISPSQAAKQYLRWKSECERKAKDPRSPWNNQLCTQEERQWFREYDLQKLEALWVLSEGTLSGESLPREMGLEEGAGECPLIPVLRRLYGQEIGSDFGSGITLCGVVCPKVLGTRQVAKDGACQIRLRLLGIEKVSL